jgi:glycosyltransferase involved in cell wall biosynthesis
MAQAMSFLSVIVATYKDRAEVLRAFLDRLHKQTLPRDRFEVLVADDGSIDHTPQMMADYIQAGTLPLRYLRHDEHRGPGYTQNRAIRECRGPWVLQLCNDMHPEPQVLEVHYQTHAQHPEPNVVVAGKVVQSPELPRTVFLQNWDPFRHSQLRQHQELTYLQFGGCHISFKKEFMLQCGMFLERPASAHEDIEVGWRLYHQGGMRLLYRQDAVAYHYHLETLDDACKRAYERGWHFDVLADRVPDPAIYIKNHLVTWKTIPLILQAYRTSRPCILDEDRHPAWFFLREALRRLIFNRLTVPWLFVPLIRHAEHHRLLARLVSPRLIRGTVSYHFLQGYKALQRRQAAARASQA